MVTQGRLRDGRDRWRNVRALYHCRVDSSNCIAREPLIWHPLIFLLPQANSRSDSPHGNSTVKVKSMEELSWNARKLPHAVIVRAPGLLPMLYTLNELEEELKISSRIIRGWLQKDLPYRQDGRGHIFVNGRDLAAWVSRVQQSRPRRTLGAGQAFCVRCHKPVTVADVQSHRQGTVVRYRGTCPECGAAINRVKNNGPS